MKNLADHFLNSILLLALSTMLIFPVLFSGLVVNPKILSESGAVLGAMEEKFGENLRVFDISRDGLVKKVEFTVFPGQETYYRDFAEITNESRKGRNYTVRIVEVSGGLPQSDVAISFRRDRGEVVLSPGESSFLSLVVHASRFKSSEPYKATVTFEVTSN